MSDAKRVLLVEDDEPLARIWAWFLQRHVPGAVVDYALTAQECMERLARADYAMIVLDIMMFPDPSWAAAEVENGFWSGILLHKQACALLKASRRPVPVWVALTALRDARNELAQAATDYFDRAGIDWVDKPIDPRALAVRIAAALELPKPFAQAQEA